MEKETYLILSSSRSKEGKKAFIGGTNPGIEEAQSRNLGL